MDQKSCPEMAETELRTGYATNHWSGNRFSSTHIKLIQQVRDIF